MTMPQAKIIYLREFPEEDPEAIVNEAAEFCGNSCGESGKLPTLKDVLAVLDYQYEFIPRPGAEKKVKRVVELAVSFCEAFRIDTAILRHTWGVEVTLTIRFSLYDGVMKRVLENLICLSDDISIIGSEDKSDCVCLCMTYYTHDICRCE